MPILNIILPTPLPTAQEIWETRYPCGTEGGWVHYRILSLDELEDVVKFIEVRKKPLRRKTI